MRFRSAPYQKQASTVRNTHSVRKKASYGTRRIFSSIRCKKQAFPVRKGYSVRKTAYWGTRRIFKGPQNSQLHRLWTASCRSGRIFRGVPCQKQYLPQRQPLQCATRPRSEVSRQKKWSRKIVTTFLICDWLTLKCMNLKPSQS